MIEGSASMHRPRLVVLGAGGMLGRAFLEAAPMISERYDLAFFGRADCDIRDLQDIENAIHSEVAIVLNCAAWTDVDGAEENRQGAFELNHEAPRMLAERCMRTNTKLVHFSTDYVFDGEASEPYQVDGQTGPLNIYGQSKLLGEQAVRDAKCEHLIIRSSWLFAPWGKNFVRTMLRLGTEREELRVVEDQVGRPTSCLDLAQATLALLDRGAQGTFHIANTGETSWYQFAVAIMERAKLQCRVIPCASSAYPASATRPERSVLSLDRLDGCEPPIRMRPWQEALDDVLARIANEERQSISLERGQDG